MIVVGLITCEGWGSANEPRSSWRRSAQGWSSPRRGSEESEVGRVSARYRCNAQVSCNVWHCAMRCDDFGQDTIRKASCCAWATRVCEVNAWRDDCILKNNCDNRLGQARWQSAHEKNVCAAGVSIDCQEIEFPASEMSHLEFFFKKKHCSLRWPPAVARLPPSWRRWRRMHCRKNIIFPSRWIKSVRIFFVPFELLVGPLSDLLLWRNWSVSASSNYCMLMVQSFACLFCIFKVIELIQWCMSMPHNLCEAAINIGVDMVLDELWWILFSALWLQSFSIPAWLASSSFPPSRSSFSISENTSSKTSMSRKSASSPSLGAPILNFYWLSMVAKRQHLSFSICMMASSLLFTPSSKSLLPGFTFPACSAKPAAWGTSLPRRVSNTMNLLYPPSFRAVSAMKATSTFSIFRTDQVILQLANSHLEFSTVLHVALHFLVSVRSLASHGWFASIPSCRSRWACQVSGNPPSRPLFLLWTLDAEFLLAWWLILPAADGLQLHRFSCLFQHILCSPHFQDVNRSHILLMKPSDPKAADSLPRETLCLIISFQTAMANFVSPLSVSLWSWQFPQRLIVCGLPSSSTKMAARSLNLKPSSLHLLSHTYLTQPNRSPHWERSPFLPSSCRSLPPCPSKTRNPARLSRFLPHYRFPLLLRTSNTAHGTLVLQWALANDVKPTPSLELLAPDAAFQGTPPPAASRPSTLRRSSSFFHSSLFSNSSSSSAQILPVLLDYVTFCSRFFRIFPWWAFSASRSCTRRSLGAPGNPFPCFFAWSHTATSFPTFDDSTCSSQSHHQDLPRFPGVSGVELQVKFRVFHLHLLHLHWRILWWAKPCCSLLHWHPFWWRRRSAPLSGTALKSELCRVGLFLTASGTALPEGPSIFIFASHSSATPASRFLEKDENVCGSTISQSESEADDMSTWQTKFPSEIRSSTRGTEASTRTHSPHTSAHSQLPTDPPLPPPNLSRTHPSKL